MDTIQQLFEFLESSKFMVVVKAIVIIIFGYYLGKFCAAAAVKLMSKQLSAHAQLILRRVIFYSILILLGATALRQLGFDLSVILGAAGILTVAIGFASQTSASNLISGLFLMAERPFSVKDIIRVNGTTGEVISIDLLAVKLRTFDNLFVRIPNESMIKSEVVTLTKFPIRRIDLILGVAYKEDIAFVREILMDIARDNPLCLEEPAPLFIFTGFGSSSLDIQFSIWAQRENFLKLKNAMFEEIKKQFDEKGVEIPFPHLSLYTGSETSALPVSIKKDT